ncbi:MAG TPA: glycosyltransferase family 9 protein, partial [Chloroflexota bacterium]|nr:glycosyltransferase family 9 protein [Chloroflexota bacterium]
MPTGEAARDPGVVTGACTRPPDPGYYSRAVITGQPRLRAEGTQPSQGARRPATVLVWLGGALGDTLLGYPALAALRTWAPDGRIVLVSRPAYAAFAATSGLVDQVVDSDGAMAGALFGGSSRPLEAPELAVIWSAAYRELSEQVQNMGARVIIAAPPRPSDPRHQARYLLDCLRPLGVRRTLLPAPPPLLNAAPRAEQALLGGHLGRTALLHPGAGSAWKCWPLASWLILAEALSARGLVVRWSFGPDDERLRADLFVVAPEWRPATLPVLPLPRFADLLARCGLFVSPDTGVAHLAALLQTPQITLFGPTDPRRWRPLSRKAVL